MAAPFVATIKTPNGLMGSVVMDREDFDLLADEIASSEIYVMNEGQRSTAMASKIKEAGYIPLIKKGIRTSWLFDRFGVTADFMAIIVRGMGRKMVQETQTGVSLAPSLN